jgi:hypothetical protein
MDEMDGAEIWKDVFVFVLIFLDRLHNYACVFTAWFNVQWVCVPMPAMNSFKG